MDRKFITLRDVILGGQDGLVNVLGLTLGLFSAGATARVIIVAGLAGGLSEAVSMGAVAYTSASADANRLRTEKPIQRFASAVVVGISALVCAVIPIAPFVLGAPALGSIIFALVASAAILFGFGVARAERFGGSIWKSGLQILLIGFLSAAAGFLIGVILKIE
jgi:VIT1/CCC1 family predicted Fe2+/Mn2+ transporter